MEGLHGDDDDLDNAHLMRMAGRFARRVRAFAGAHEIPVIDCGRGERKHRIAEVLALRDHVVAPILAGVRSPRRGRKPNTWTTIDRDYETLRSGMHTLFDHLGINTDTAAAAA